MENLKKLIQSRVKLSQDDIDKGEGHFRSMIAAQMGTGHCLGSWIETDIKGNPTHLVAQWNCPENTELPLPQGMKFIYTHPLV